MMTRIIGIILLFLTGFAQASTIELSTADNPIDQGLLNQGWWADQYANFVFNDNYFTGYCETCDLVGTARSYFIFDLSEITTQISAASLQIRLSGSLSPDRTELIELYDVSTDVISLSAREVLDISIFDDLGSGNLYGSTEVIIGSPPSTIIEFDLNAVALADLNANLGGYFAIGASLATIDQSASDQYAFAFSTGFANQLTITTVPVPASFWLLGSVLGLLGISGRSARV